MNEFLTAWQPRALSLLRFIAGFLFVWHGTQKLFNYPAGQPGTEFSLTHFTTLSPLILVAGALEFFGGLLLIVGLFTRWTAFVLSGMMAVAYFMAHGLNAFLPIVNKGELAVLYSFVFLFLFFAGGGPIGLDSLLKKSDR
jgi:putative oxidoreductase